jgi:hypothetical protein
MRQEAEVRRLMTTWLGLTAMRQESEDRRFNGYLVRFDRHEAGSRGEDV